ncbi:MULTISPECIES: DUF1848 domain-containing protein [Prosthecochloris]|uniref:DUF1848 domain-containing protein n=1 Tax=Prosthecochloris vibrioformis TaxID=1098 RepID=A0A5C4S5G0_PROVB|nr:MULTISPECIES: DUF1848 domain-containing protein [Prosthecochloris]ANT65693.1 hypothetical protein Ptc2401_01963 [Prosthecochloris sp. CIB 2401]TNJ37931.1 DUF1848 domain-containing protein [Prosthecochloris vibrioformis]
MCTLFGNDKMVISASRRTDIPAFYAEWFIRRLEAGSCAVRNPYDRSRFREVSLRADDVAAFVFWTRFPRPLRLRYAALEHLGIPSLFHLTVTGYPRRFEPGMPTVEEVIAECEQLAGLIGQNRIVWRYDPVMLAPEIDVGWHIRNFRWLCERLHRVAGRIVVTFIQHYPHVAARSDRLGCHSPGGVQKETLASSFLETAASFGMPLHGCGRRDGAEFFLPGRCIDSSMLRELFGLELSGRKDPGQPDVCGCMRSIDIGAYGSCLHRCGYCYATRDFREAERFHAMHDPLKPWL